MITCRLQERLFDAKIKDETKDESFSISEGKKVERIQREYKYNAMPSSLQVNFSPVLISFIVE